MSSFKIQTSNTSVSLQDSFNTDIKNLNIGKISGRAVSTIIDKNSKPIKKTEENENKNIVNKILTKINWDIKKTALITTCVLATVGSFFIAYRFLGNSENHSLNTNNNPTNDNNTNENPLIFNNTNENPLIFNNTIKNQPNNGTNSIFPDRNPSSNPEELPQPTSLSNELDKNINALKPHSSVLKELFSQKKTCPLKETFSDPLSKQCNLSRKHEGAGPDEDKVLNDAFKWSECEDKKKTCREIEKNSLSECQKKFVACIPR